MLQAVKIRIPAKNAKEAVKKLDYWLRIAKEASEQRALDCAKSNDALSSQQYIVAIQDMIQATYTMEAGEET